MEVVLHKSSTFFLSSISWQYFEFRKDYYLITLKCFVELIMHMLCVTYLTLLFCPKNGLVYMERRICRFLRGLSFCP